MIISDSIKYVIIQASDCYFGFNLQDDVERACIYALIHTKSTKAINGWMVSTMLPEWVGGYSSWLTYEKDFVKFQIPDSVMYSAPKDSNINKADNDQSDSDVSDCFVVRKRLAKSSGKVTYSSSDEEEFELKPKGIDEQKVGEVRKVGEVKLKSNVVLTSSKTKGDHLNNKTQEETVQK